ncbi:MAG TPA: hypothetical protein VLW84_08840 [Terriglobales bacterium]|nr:hypothetical protein [Terriglobales bacterium]
MAESVSAAQTDTGKVAIVIQQNAERSLEVLIEWMSSVMLASLRMGRQLLIMVTPKVLML